MLRYPVKLTPDDNGTILVTAPDLPEVSTFGEDATNALVRAALIPPEKAEGLIYVDGVPNSVRAPLVWAYLQQHFEPDFSEGDVVFWRRRITP